MEFASDEDFQAYARSSGHAFVSFTLFQAETKLGTLTLELYTDVAPSTCKHFLELTTGKGPHRYKGTPIHRVVKQAFIQGGDVVDGTGKGDPKFTIPDETFSMKHDDRGIVAMANNGTPHSASSQFYITLHPLPWLDGKRVAFGKVLTAEGFKVLEQLEGMSLNNERPVPEVVITEAAVLYVPEQS